MYEYCIRNRSDLHEKNTEDARTAGDCEWLIKKETAQVNIQGSRLNKTWEVKPTKHNHKMVDTF